MSCGSGRERESRSAMNYAAVRWQWDESQYRLYSTHDVIVCLMCVDFNQKMYSIRCIIVWASLLSWLRFAAAYNFPLTSIDARTSNYLRQEEEAWRSFPRPNLTDSIEVIYTTHSSNLDFNHGLMEYIWPYSDQLAQNITELNRTASRVLELVKKRSRWDLQNLADFIIRDVPRKLNAIFAEVKSLSFQQYLSTVRKTCEIWLKSKKNGFICFFFRTLIVFSSDRTRTHANQRRNGALIKHNWKASLRMSLRMCTKQYWKG